MKWKVDQLKGVGAIVFNQKRSQVRKNLPSEPHVYAQSEAILPHDTYEEEGLFVMYDKYDRCGAVEFMKPVELWWNDKNLFDFNFVEALDLLKQKDPTIMESEKDAISFALGISIFAPDKDINPNAPIESITIFRENYFYRKIGVSDPSVFQSLLIQPGFVNSIIEDKYSFENLEDAYRHIFRNNTEKLILVWNSLPIQWSYTDDIPSFADSLIDGLHAMLTNPQAGEKTISLDSPDIESTWTLKWDGDYVSISSFWNRIHDGYEQVINQWQNITMLQSEFMWEWKILCEQLLGSIDDAGATGVQDLPAFTKLEVLAAGISNSGRFYREEMRELYF